MLWWGSLYKQEVRTQRIRPMSGRGVRTQTCTGCHGGRGVRTQTCMGAHVRTAQSLSSSRKVPERVGLGSDQVKEGGSPQRDYVPCPRE